MKSTKRILWCFFCASSSCSSSSCLPFLAARFKHSKSYLRIYFGSTLYRLSRQAADNKKEGKKKKKQQLLFKHLPPCCGVDGVRMRSNRWNETLEPCRSTYGWMVKLASKEINSFETSNGNILSISWLLTNMWLRRRTAWQCHSTGFVWTRNWYNCSNKKFTLKMNFGPLTEDASTTDGSMQTRMKTIQHGFILFGRQHQNNFRFFSFFS